MDAGDAQFLSGNEFEHLLSRLCCGSRIDVVGDARVGEGELHSWKVDDVAPDEKLIAAGLNEPRRVARSMAGCGEGADAGGDEPSSRPPIATAERAAPRWTNSRRESDP